MTTEDQATKVLHEDAKVGDVGTLKIKGQASTLRYKWFRHLGGNGPEILDDTVSDDPRALLIFSALPSKRENRIGYAIAHTLSRPTSPAQAVWLESNRKAEYPFMLWRWVKKFGLERLKVPPANIVYIGSTRRSVILRGADEKDTDLLNMSGRYLSDPRVGVSNRARSLLDYRIPEKVKNKPGYSYPAKEYPEGYEISGLARDAYCMALEVLWYGFTSHSHFTTRRYTDLRGDRS